MMATLAGCEVSLFSLESNLTEVPASSATSARPLFLSGLAIQSCTADVMSTAMKSPSLVTATCLATGAPMLGAPANVTVDSFHRPLTMYTLKVPGF